MITVLDYDQYIRLVTDSAILHDLKAEQLPELRLAIVVILVLVAACIGLGVLLRHEERENKQLHSIINEDHHEDKLTEKEAFESVNIESHNNGSGTFHVVQKGEECICPRCGHQIIAGTFVKLNETYNQFECPKCNMPNSKYMALKMEEQ